jgi:hypothetical protein
MIIYSTVNVIKSQIGNQGAGMAASAPKSGRVGIGACLRPGYTAMDCAISFVSCMTVRHASVNSPWRVMDKAM